MFVIGWGKLWFDDSSYPESDELSENALDLDEEAVDGGERGAHGVRLGHVGFINLTSTNTAPQGPA